MAEINEQVYVGDRVAETSIHHMQQLLLDLWYRKCCVSWSCNF